jgi:type IV pilus assembly protein PilC
MKPYKQLARVYHNLSILLDAGIPLLASLEKANQGGRGKLISVFNDLTKEVSAGQDLSTSMKKHRSVFAEFDCTLVQVCEKSGELDQCFRMLSDWYTFVLRLKRIMISAMALPMVVLHIGAFISCVPAWVFSGFDDRSFLLNVLGVLGLFYVPCFCVLVVFVLGKNVSGLRLILESMVLRVPALGIGLKELAISRYAKSFAMLYKAGLPITEALEISPRIAGLHAAKQMFLGGADCAHEGKMASEGFSSRVPTEYKDLWQIGEESGRLDQTVDKIAEIASDRAIHKLEVFSKWLPRFIYAFICFILIRQMGKMLGQLGQSHRTGF